MEGTDYWSTAVQITDLILSMGQDSVVAIDISSMARRFFFLLLREIVTAGGPIVILYTEPGGYSDTISRGAGPVSSYEGFGGIKDVKKDTLVILQIGFEGDRAQAIADYFDGRPIIPIAAFPGFRPGNLELALFRNRTALGGLKGVDYKLSPAVDPYETARVIDQIRKRNPDYNHVLVPLGTKPQSLGAALVAIADQSVNVTDTPAAESVDAPTLGVGRTWLYEVNLRDLTS